MQMVLLKRFLSTSGKRLQKGPLEGIRILDLTRVLAGPYCTQMLGDLGASVVKVEVPGTGDETRNWGPPFADNIVDKNGVKETAYFICVNRNKKSITLDFKNKKGLQVIERLIKKSDVLVENYVPGKLDELGLGYERVKTLNPRLIYASISGYGPTGPYANKAGYDVVIEGEAGLMHITGEEEGNPVKVGVAITDLTTGLYTKGAILAALFAREKTGVGQKIDVSLLECQVASLANIGSNYLIAGREAKRMGTSHGAIVPYQSFKTSDGGLVVGAGNDRQFSRFCDALNRPDLALSALYSSNQLRVKNRKELVDELCRTISKMPTSYWLRALENTGLPHGPINNIEQTLNHPQVAHRKMIETVEHPTAGKIKVVGLPVKYSCTKPSIRLPPPLLGQHTVEILTDLGFSSLEIKELKRVKAV